MYALAFELPAGFVGPDLEHDEAPFGAGTESKDEAEQLAFAKGYIGHADPLSSRGLPRDLFACAHLSVDTG